jgi:hypothetical protein
MNRIILIIIFLIDIFCLLNSINIIHFFQILIQLKFKYWGLGIGDWGLGIGDWAQSPIPNPHS